MRWGWLQVVASPNSTMVWITSSPRPHIPWPTLPFPYVSIVPSNSKIPMPHTYPALELRPPDCHNRPHIRWTAWRNVCFLLHDIVSSSQASSALNVETACLIQFAGSALLGCLADSKYPPGGAQVPAPWAFRRLPTRKRRLSCGTCDDASTKTLMPTRVPNNKIYTKKPFKMFLLIFIYLL